MSEVQSVNHFQVMSSEANALHENYMKINCDQMTTEICNQYFYIIKAIAVLSIISAHCSDVSANASEMSQAVSLFMRSVGAVGVGVFFVVSGYFYPFSVAKSSNLLSFFKRKMISIIVPWTFCATLVYWYVALRKGGGISGWLLSILGYMSSFWYMSVLLVLFIIFFYLYNNKTFLAFTVLASVVSSFIVGVRILPASVCYVYLNPFNWMIYFALGISINGIGVARVVYFMSKLRHFSVISVVLIWSIMAYYHVCNTYSSVYYLPLELLGILAVMGWGMECCKHFNKVKNMLFAIGKRSFSIYLLHMLGFAGVTVWLFNRADWWWTIPLRPFIVCAGVYFSISIGHWVAKKIHVDKFFSILIGYRP